MNNSKKRGISMENSCITDLDKAIADLNKNINDLLSLLQQINTEIMKLKEKALTNNMQINIDPQRVSLDNNLKKDNN